MDVLKREKRIQRNVPVKARTLAVVAYVTREEKAINANAHNMIMEIFRLAGTTT